MSTPKEILKNFGGLELRYPPYDETEPTLDTVYLVGEMSRTVAEIKSLSETPIDFLGSNPTKPTRPIPPGLRRPKGFRQSVKSRTFVAPKRAIGPGYTYDKKISWDITEDTCLIFTSEGRIYLTDRQKNSIFVHEPKITVYYNRYNRKDKIDVYASNRKSIRLWDLLKAIRKYGNQRDYIGETCYYEGVHLNTKTGEFELYLGN